MLSFMFYKVRYSTSHGVYVLVIIFDCIEFYSKLNDTNKTYDYNEMYRSFLPNVGVLNGESESPRILGVFV